MKPRFLNILMAVDLSAYDKDVYSEMSDDNTSSRISFDSESELSIKTACSIEQTEMIECLLGKITILGRVEQYIVSPEGKVNQIGVNTRLLINTQAYYQVPLKSYNLPKNSIFPNPLLPPFYPLQQTKLNPAMP